MTINLRTVIKIIILLVLTVTLFVSYGEVSSLLTGEQADSAYATKAKTPVYIKFLKDLCFMLIIVISSIHILKKKGGQSSFMFFGIFSSFIIMLFLISCIASSFLTAAAGIRWAIPMMLPFFLIQYMDDLLMNRIAKLLLLIFIVHFLMQVYQLFNMTNIYGINFMGLAARSPGVFFGPNSAGFFSIMVLFFVIFFSNSKSIKVIMFVLAFISSILTMSGTAIMAYILFALFVVQRNKYRKVLFTIVPLLVIMFFPIMVFLSGRGRDYLEWSLLPRVEIFINLLMNGEFISTRFGASTNTAALLILDNWAKTTDSVIGADSTYSSIIGNTGLLGLFLFVLLCVFLIIYAIKVNRVDLYLFMIIYALYGATTIIFEAFPMNFLFSIYIAYILKHQLPRCKLRGIQTSKLPPTLSVAL